MRMSNNSTLSRSGWSGLKDLQGLQDRAGPIANKVIEGGPVDGTEQRSGGAGIQLARPDVGTKDVDPEQPGPDPRPSNLFH